MTVLEAAPAAPQFVAQFLAAQRPVLLRGAAAGWRFRKRGRKKSFLKRYGDALGPEGARAPACAVCVGTRRRWQ